MQSLTGKRAVVIGPGRQYAASLTQVLAAQGAQVLEDDEVPALDGLDILVTCPSPATQAPGGSLDEALIDVANIQRWSAAAADTMRKRRSGVIVHVTGISGLGGWPGWEASAPAFAAVHNLTSATAVGLAREGIRVNALVPGITAELGATIAATTGLTLDAVRARIPTGSFLSSESLGHALLYLVHDSASYVSGEILTVDGGWDIWGRLNAAAAP